MTKITYIFVGFKTDNASLHVFFFLGFEIRLSCLVFAFFLAVLQQLV